MNDTARTAARESVQHRTRPELNDRRALARGGLTELRGGRDYLLDTELLDDERAKRAGAQAMRGILAVMRYSDALPDNERDEARDEAEDTYRRLRLRRYRLDAERVLAFARRRMPDLAASYLNGELVDTIADDLYHAEGAKPWERRDRAA